MDWRTWHADYEDSESALARRLVVVQEQIRAALDRAAPGPVRAISVCAGQGHDLIRVLVDHPRRAEITARLVELDEHNVLTARRATHTAGLDMVEVVAGDASVTDAYAGAVPADLILLCGVLGNISAADIANTIRRLPLLCAPAATVIWTRHRHPPDLTPYIRETFEQGGSRSSRSRTLHRSASVSIACWRRRSHSKMASGSSSSSATTSFSPTFTQARAAMSRTVEYPSGRELRKVDRTRRCLMGE